MLRIACVVVLAGLALGGCGGGNDKPKREAAAESPAPAPGRMSEAEREAEERKHVPGKRLSARDRVAYYQIATTSGLLRARAATVLSGLRGTPRATLKAGRERLDLVRPEDGDLVTLGGALRDAIDALLKRENGQGAKAAIRASTRINEGLTRFSNGKAVRLLNPD